MTMKRFVRNCRDLIVLVSVILGAQMAQASDMEPVTLAPIVHLEATLTIVDANGVSHDYTPAQLEEFATYGMETTTPWRQEPARFEGILLIDLLAAHGLTDLDAIEVVAENDYKSKIERDAWMSGAFMIATRVDGMAHSRRVRGPLQFVVPAAAAEAGIVLERHMVWMARTIQPAS